MRADDRQQLVAFEELTRCLVSVRSLSDRQYGHVTEGNVREEVRAASYVIVYETVGSLLLAEVFDRV